MKIKGRKEYYKALIIDAIKIKELYVLILSYSENVECSVKTIQKNTIHFHDIAELLEYDNFGEDRIESLKFLGRTKDYRTISIDIEPSNKYGFYNSPTVTLSYELTDNSDVRKLNDNVEKIVKKINADYILAAHRILSILAYLAAVFLSFLFSLSLFEIANLDDLRNAVNSLTDFEIAMRMLVWAACFTVLLFSYKWFLSSFVISPLKEKLFPLIIFLLGEEKIRFGKLSKLMNNIFWGIIISAGIGIVVSIASAIIYAKFLGAN